MSDEFSIDVSAYHSENLSPAAEEAGWLQQQVDERMQYDHAAYQMSGLESVAKSLGIAASVSQNREMESKGNYYGGGPIVDYSTLLHVAGVISAAAAFLKTARPIIVELIKNKRTSFTFKQGDITIKCESQDSLEEIEAYTERLLQRTKPPSGQDRDVPGDGPPGSGQTILGKDL